MVVDRDGERLLGGVLADDVASRNSRISAGLGSSSSLTSSASASSSSMISLHRSMHSSQMYTPGTRDELLHLLLALSTERALQQVTAVSNARHLGASYFLLPSVVTPLVTPFVGLLRVFTRRYPFAASRCDR